MTAKELSDRVLVRLDDEVASPGSVRADPTVGNVPPEILSALNEGQDLFAVLTLCLETTAPLTLAASTTFSTIRATFPDFICPLRLMIGSIRIRPATMTQLDALNDQWQDTAGVPSRYFSRGFNFFGISPQPVSDTVASMTYARSPVQLIADAFPEIPEADHSALEDFAIYRVKLKEGAQGLQRGLIYFNKFLDTAAARAEFVRARSKAAGYDVAPFELQLFDRSKFQEPKPQKGPK